MKSQRLALATRLVDAGAGVTACRVLGDLRGAAANSLRLRARHSQLQSRVYALGVLPGAMGMAWPLEPIPGELAVKDSNVTRGFRRAWQATLKALQPWNPPSLRFELDPRFILVGDSIELAAAIAFVAYLLPKSRKLKIPVFATGCLADDGRVESVEFLEAKIEIALAELRGGPGVIFIPGNRSEGSLQGINHISDALTFLFGEAPLHPDPALIALDEVIERSRREMDHDMAAAALQSVSRHGLAEADRARLELELGTRLGMRVELKRRVPHIQ